jgi:hypothetical protein
MAQMVGIGPFITIPLMMWMALGAVAYLIWARYEKVWPFGPKEIREAFLEEQRVSPQTE